MSKRRVARVLALGLKARKKSSPDLQARCAPGSGSTTRASCPGRWCSPARPAGRLADARRCVSRSPTTYVRSGSRASVSGVGTQMMMASQSVSARKSVVARKRFPAATHARGFDVPDVALPLASRSTFAASTSSPMTRFPASTMVNASGSPTYPNPMTPTVAWSEASRCFKSSALPMSLGPPAFRSSRSASVCLKNVAARNGRVFASPPSIRALLRRPCTLVASESAELVDFAAPWGA